MCSNWSLKTIAFSLVCYGQYTHTVAQSLSTTQLESICVGNKQGSLQHTITIVHFTYSVYGVI